MYHTFNCVEYTIHVSEMYYSNVSIVMLMCCVSRVKAVFEKNAIFDNLSCETVVNTKMLGSSRSKVECSSHCIKETDCRGFFFNKDGKSCHGVNLILTSSLGCNSNMRNVYYDIPATAPTFTQSPSMYGRPCSATSDCMSANVICLEGTCQCDAGYRLDSFTCVANCANYGSSYIKYSNMALYVTPIQDYVYVSLDQCQSYCSNSEVACMGFNYVQSTQRCRIKSATPLTSPSAWGSSIGVDYYSRNCS